MATRQQSDQDSLQLQQTLQSQPPRRSPRFSIILCTYNRRNMVLSALASLRRQTLSYEQFEVIVIDNGSTDGSFAAINAYVNTGKTQQKGAEQTWHVRCLMEPRNGLAYARNTGLRSASGSIAVFLDDDMLAESHFLEHLLLAYEETKADAIGGRVELRWEALRPYWLTDDLLDLLGYFSPSKVRTPLPEASSFSSCCFSVKMEVLQSIGYFLPILGKGYSTPTNIAIDDFCRRLRQAGYALWYEPTAVVTHRAHEARLKQAYFVGRAYWQGCSEVLMQSPGSNHMTLRHLIRAILPEIFTIAHFTLLHRPLQIMAGKSTSEKLLAAMAQARSWGHIKQQLRLFAHASATTTAPSVLFIRPDETDGHLLWQELFAPHPDNTMCLATIPLSWLWRYRSCHEQPIGIIHIYRPGALNLTHWQRQQFLFRLRLAQHLNLRIVTTDMGGWWQDTQSLYALARRTFERTILACSHIVFTYTRQLDQLYPDKNLHRRIRILPHPGLRGYYPPPVDRRQAYAQLGLPDETNFVYLCLTQMHTERELVLLSEAFAEVQQKLARSDDTASIVVQLLLVGTPGDRTLPTQILKKAASNSSMHIVLEFCEEDMPLYLGAAHAIVLPHFAQPSAGTLATAMLSISYERVVVAPDLPRFRGTLPPQTCVNYDPASRTSLVQALLTAQGRAYHLTAKEQLELEVESGRERHASRLLEIYRHLLAPPKDETSPPPRKVHNV